MLIVIDDKQALASMDFIADEWLSKAHYATFDDIRWHRLRSIPYEIIILIPSTVEISYHLKYLRMTSNASILVISDKHESIANTHRTNIFCFKPTISKDFFSGCLITLTQKHKKELYHSVNFMHTMQTGKFILTHMQQVALLSKALANLSDNKAAQLRRGIYELLLNAFEHGVYQIGFELKQALIENKKYFSELNKRIRDPAFKNKCVEVIMHQKEDGTYINITDPGLGFDYQSYLAFNKNLSDSRTGRGIAYAANYCFDQLTYKDEGKSVFVVLNKVLESVNNS